MACPLYIEPCLPKLVELAPTGERWIHEIKHDGYRLAVRIDAGDIRLLSRRGLNWLTRFPLVHQAAQGLHVASAYIDGEVVIEGDDGISDWPALHSCASAGRCPNAILWAFDLLYHNGVDLRAIPLIERKAKLSALLAASPHTGIRYVDYLEGDGRRVFEHACVMGLEGIVSKLRDSRYRSGKFDAWQKTKCQQRGEFVIAGYIPNAGDARAVGALILSEWNGCDLIRSGRVGTGWSARTARELAAALDMIIEPAAPFAIAPSRKTYPGARWVRPGGGIRPHGLLLGVTDLGAHKCRLGGAEFHATNSEKNANLCYTSRLWEGLPMLRLLVSVVLFYCIAVPGSAADYAVEQETTHKSQTKSSPVAGGTLHQNLHTTRAYVVDKDTGVVFSCYFSLNLWFINDTFDKETQKVHVCNKIIVPPAQTVTSFTFPAVHLSIETRPGWTVFGNDYRYWYVNETTVNACLVFGRTVPGYPSSNIGSYTCQSITINP